VDNPVFLANATFEKDLKSVIHHCTSYIVPFHLKDILKEMSIPLQQCFRHSGHHLLSTGNNGSTDWAVSGSS
jgi:hypothetical protein